MTYPVQYRRWGSHARFETRSFATEVERAEFIRERLATHECIPEEWGTEERPVGSTSERRRRFRESLGWAMEAWSGTLSKLAGARRP